MTEATNTSNAEYILKSGQRTYIFVLLFLLYFFDVVDRYMVSSMFPFIQKEWGLTDMQSGLLVSTVYWSIVVFVIPGSIIIDRWSRRKTISIMAVLWSIASMACAFVGNFTQLFTARTFLGIGEAGYGAGGTAMIAGLYPIEKRGRMMGLWNASIPLATAMAIALGGIIATRWGWRAAFGLTALPGLIVAILFFFIKDYKTVALVKTVTPGAGDGTVKDQNEGRRCRQGISPYADAHFHLPRHVRGAVRGCVHHHLAAYLFQPYGPYSNRPGRNQSRSGHVTVHYRRAPGRFSGGPVGEETPQLTASFCSHNNDHNGLLHFRGLLPV